MDLQDEIEKLITRRDGHPLVKIPRSKRRSPLSKQRHRGSQSPSRSRGSPVTSPSLRESNRRVAELLRISREKIAQQQKIGANDDKRKKKKKKKKGKRKSFPSEWVMKFGKNEVMLKDPERKKAPLVQKYVCHKCHLAYETVPIEGLLGPMECKVVGICDNCKPMTKEQRLAKKQAARAEAELAATRAKEEIEKRKTPIFPKKRPPKVKVRTRKTLCKSLYTFIHEKVHEDWDGLAVRAKDILARSFTREDLIGMARGPPRLQPRHSIDYYQQMFQDEAEAAAATTP